MLRQYFVCLLRDPRETGLARDRHEIFPTLEQEQ